MNNVIKFNFKIRHLMNEMMGQGIVGLITLVSMMSVLGHFLDISGIPLLIFLMLLSFFAFVLSETIFNRFIYKRNNYIHSAFIHHNESMFKRPCKLICNSTWNKLPKSPRIYVKYPHIKTNVTKIYKDMKGLEVYCHSKRVTSKLNPEFKSFQMLLCTLVKLNTSNKRSKPRGYDDNYNILDLNIRWYHFRNKLNAIDAHDVDTDTLNNIRLYQDKINDVVNDFNKE